MRGSVLSLLFVFGCTALVIVINVSLVSPPPYQVRLLPTPSPRLPPSMTFYDLMPSPYASMTSDDLPRPSMPFQVHDLR